MFANKTFIQVCNVKVSAVEQFIISSYFAGGATVAVGVGAPAAKTAVESSTRVVGWWLAGCAGTSDQRQLLIPVVSWFVDEI
jgi:hypothetical protein